MSTPATADLPRPVPQSFLSGTMAIISKIQKFIKQNYQEMYLKWSAYSEQGFYNKK